MSNWSADEMKQRPGRRKPPLMLYAGNSLDKARSIFARTTKHRQ
jgi:hypothetical protein